MIYFTLPVNLIANLRTDRWPMNITHWRSTLTPEVIEWIEINIRRKSDVQIRDWTFDKKLKKYVYSNPPTISFGTERDAILFKMRWL